MEQRKRLFCLIIFGPIVQKQTDFSPVWTGHPSSVRKRNKRIGCFSSIRRSWVDLLRSFWTTNAKFQSSRCAFTNNTTKTDAAPWSYKWTRLDWDGSPGEVRYGAVPIIEFEFSVVIFSPLNNVGLKMKWLRRTLSTWSSTLFLFSPARSSPSPSSASLPVSI